MVSDAFKIQQAIGPHEDHLTFVKRRELKVVWTCLPFIRSRQNHLARYSERGKKARQTEKWENNIREWTGLQSSLSPRGQLRIEKNGGKLF